MNPSYMLDAMALRLWLRGAGLTSIPAEQSVVDQFSTWVRQNNSATLMIPMPVYAEVLALLSDSEPSAEASFLEATKGLIRVPFDEAAALTLGRHCRVMGGYKSAKQMARDLGRNYQHFKVDLQIVAIAKSRNSRLISNDSFVRNACARCQVPCLDAYAMPVDEDPPTPAPSGDDPEYPTGGLFGG